MHIISFRSCAYAIAVAACTALLSIPHAAHGATLVGGQLTVDTTWSADRSPYLLTEQVHVPPGVTLTIGKGVVVNVASSAEDLPNIWVNGTLVVAGTAEEHVTIDGLSDVTIDQGSASLSYADLSVEYELAFIGAEGHIASSSMTGAENGLFIKESTVRVSASKIVENGRGIFIAGSGPFQVNASATAGTGGLGNALEDARVSVAGSSISDNSEGGIVNESGETVDAVGNWWGSAAGPNHEGADTVRGLVGVEPWLTKDPFEISEKVCCSSVLFLPGLQATRLHAAQNQLWEPNRNDDVRKLYLDTNGISLRRDVSVGDPIARAYGMYGIYAKFMAHLDDLRSRGVIAEWKAFGYDWRRPVSDIVASSVARGTTTDSLVPVVEQLAARSPTGKVTIVAHSHGGLVAKYLVKELAHRGKSELINGVISVAVPYIGTPQAIAALLSGDGQSIGGGAILRTSVARLLGINMPSAYALLPSLGYFAQRLGPTVVSASTSALTHDRQSEMLAAAGGNGVLMKAASAIHSILDPFVWPAKIARWAIVGWNATTTETVRMTKKGIEKASTTFGDGTVVMESAAAGSGSVVSINVQRASTADGTPISHANILESSEVRDTIDRMIATEGKETMSEPFLLPPSMSWGLPEKLPMRSDSVILTTHSPVELHVYDRHGNHTGPAPLPPELASQVEPGLLMDFDTDIPGSSFDIIGGTDESPHMQVTLPASGDSYSIVIKGTGFGSAVFDVAKEKDFEVYETTAYPEFPVTPFLIATTTIVAPRVRDDRSSEPLASTSGALTLDFNGDGIAEARMRMNEQPTTSTSITALKSMVETMLKGDPRAKHLLLLLDKLGRSPQRLRMFERHVGHLKLRGISSEQRDLLIRALSDFVQSR